MPRPNFYSGVGLDRADHLRLDESWFAERLREPTTRLIPVWRARSFVANASNVRAAWVEGEAARRIVTQGEHVTFLGLKEEVAYFALDISETESPEAVPELSTQGLFKDLRAVGPLLAQGDGAILAYARGLMHWHQRHRFCGRCGAPTESRRSGHVRSCTNRDCGLDHFPRTDPAVIMLVHDGENCLLGRQKDWPPGMHSTLAGFVEPGESLEEAVAREVKEEVGLNLDLARISYHSSQPWPFPSSIMLGFSAYAEKQPLTVSTLELDTADWYSRETLLNSPEDETLKLPRRDSIAWRLIEDWLVEPA